MLVNELAKRASVTSDTVRFYTRIGLLNPIKNPVNGYKEYSEKEQNRLTFILAARHLGFTVDDVTQILGEADDDKSPCSTVRRLIERRLVESEARIKEMLLLRQRMQSALAQWSTQPDQSPSSHRVCHLIENFTEANQDEVSP
jgi:DNA-binding transcriptional MerR regulator